MQVTEGNGVVTSFVFPFAIPEASDIAAYVTSSTGVITPIPSNEITVSLNTPPVGGNWSIGGSVGYPLTGSPIPTGSTFTMQRILPITQVTSLDNQGNQYPDAIEEALDTLCMQVQQVNTIAQSSIQIPVVDIEGLNTTLPAAQVRAGQYLAFDNQGNVTTTSVPPTGTAIISTAMTPVVAASTLAIARIDLGLGAVATENLGNNIVDDGAGNLVVKADSVTNAMMANTGQIAGTATNDNAAAGNIGEYISSSVNVATTGLSNNTAFNVTSITLTAGDWDISAVGALGLASSTTSTLFEAAITTTSATMPNPPNSGGYASHSGSVTTSASPALVLATGVMRASIATITTYYLVVFASFATSTAGAGGFIGARRAR